MRIGILGSGDVAQVLGHGLAACGHHVMLGSREPESPKLHAWKRKAKGKVSTGTLAEAARHGDLLFLCVHGSAAEQAIRTAGPANFEGKVVLDTTNPIAESATFPPGLFVGLNDSLGERVQRALPRARVVKAFNTVSSLQMVRPKFPGGPPDLMICGNDARAKRRASALAKQLGWPRTLDLGDITAARWLEAYLPLWMLVGRKLKTWRHVAKWVHP